MALSHEVETKQEGSIYSRGFLDAPPAKSGFDHNIGEAVKSIEAEAATRVSSNPLWDEIREQFGERFPKDVVRAIYKFEKKHRVNGHVSSDTPDLPIVELKNPTSVDKISALQNSGHTASHVSKENRVFVIVPRTTTSRP